jgi:alpha-L-rhamnosidase
MKITTLRCDYMENPVGFDFDRPSLSWVTEAEGENRRQSACQVQVALSPDFSAPCHDTGRVASAESVGVRLGMPLDPAPATSGAPGVGRGGRRERLERSRLL